MAIATSNSVPLIGDSLIDGLTQGSSWLFTGPRVLTYSFNLNYPIATDPANPLYPWDGSGGSWTAPLSSAFVQALTSWSNVANITFQPIRSGTYFYQSSADITATLTGDDLSYGFVGIPNTIIGLGVFPDPSFANQLLAALGFSRQDYPSIEGDVFFDNYYAGYSYLYAGGYGLEAIVHEIGHALGLKHPDDDGANLRPTFAQLGIANLDSDRYTVMTNTESSFDITQGHVATPMLLDILAIQSIYGANMAYHAGNDVYGIAADPHNPIQTVWDAGGIDTFDASASTQGATIDLRPGIGYAQLQPGNVGLTAIAYGVAIENAIGGSGTDSLVGNEVDNVLDGRAGNDTMIGGAGNDTYYRDSFFDVITEDFGQGIDTLVSSISFSFAFGVLQANVENATLTEAVPDGALLGNDLDNVLTGSSGANSITSYAGNDTLIGGAGGDNMAGGLGNDTYVVDNGLDLVVEGLNEGEDAVHSAVSYALGLNVEYLILTGSGNIDGTGNDLDNLIFGNLGVNVLAGGAGNDAYIVQNAGDTVTEGVGEGTDTVLSSVSFNLGANVEHLTLTGTTGGLVGTGNGLNNTLVSNGAALGSGLVGGDGNDTYVVRSVNDVVTETLTGGTDIVTAEVNFDLGANVEHIFLLGFGNLSATGNELQNVIVGNLGANTLTGGLGDDIYFVQAAGATIVEQAAQGRDTVFSFLTLTLPDNVEDLYLQGAGELFATGNALNNVLKGNSAFNILDGGAGADILIGGAGNDVYFVDQVGDMVLESPGEGTDTVLSSVNFGLGENVEHLMLTGMTGGLVGTGNSLNNTLVSNGAVLGNNLIGGDGTDTYVVRSVNDTVTETLTGGTDIVTTEVSFELSTNVEHIFLLGFGNLSATGNELQNVIVGNLGANTLTGGLGDDIYFVQAAGATIVEQVGQGRDTVFSFLDFTLPGNVEDLYLQGSALSATGNALDNVLKGTSGNNVLNGGVGNDILIGGAGDDTFVFNALSLHDLIPDFRDGVGGEEDIVDLSALGTSFENLNFTVVNGTDVSMTVNGVADFSVFFQGYTTTVNFNAGDFLF